ncbi:MAG: Gfo/Idh/MocA family oxidoreductase [Saprospiraceae bacterium]
MQRRNFIKYSSLLTASTAYPFCKPKTAAKPRKKLGVALLGLGYYSRGLLAPALMLTKYCELRGIVTGSPQKIPEWQKKYGIKDHNIYHYDNMHLIADNDDIDIIYVVTPTGIHERFALAAVNTGKHLWLEKPMAMTTDQCQNIINACEKNKLKLCIGYRMLHEPNTQAFISYVASKPYGKMAAIDSQAGYEGGGGTDWRYQKVMGGGALYDMGVYTVNGIRYACGMKPVEVLFANQWQNRPDIMGDIDETTEYILRFNNGLEAYGKTSVGENFNHLKVTCENGWYEMNPMQSYNGVVGRTSDGIQLNSFVENQQAKQMDDNALAIIKDTDVMAPGEEGMIDVGIIQAIIKSADTGIAVMI